MKPSSEADSAAAPNPKPTPQSGAALNHSASRDAAGAQWRAAEPERKNAKDREFEAVQLDPVVPKKGSARSQSATVGARRNPANLQGSATAMGMDPSNPVQPSPTLRPLPVGEHSMEPLPRQTPSTPNPSPANPSPTAAPTSQSNPVKPSPTFPRLSMARHSVEPRPCQTSSTPNPSPTRPSLATTSSASNPVKPGQASAPSSVTPSAPGSTPNQPNTRKPTHGRAIPDVTSFPTKLTAAGETAPHPAPPGQGQSRLVRPKRASIPPPDESLAPSVARFVATTVARSDAPGLPLQTQKSPMVRTPLEDLAQSPIQFQLGRRARFV
jgi:hypothetical protein